MSDRALPNLIARLLLDKTQYSQGIASVHADTAKASMLMSEQERAAKALGIELGGLGQTHQATAVAAVTAHTKAKQSVNELENAIKSTDRTVSGLAKTFEALGATSQSRLGSVASTIGSQVGGLGPAGLAAGAGLGGLAVGAGVFAELEHLASQQADFAFKTLQTSAALGTEAEHLQVLDHWGERYSIDQDTMSTQLFRFNKNLGEGAPLLQKQGISLEQLGINSHNVYEAYLQTADAVSKMNDAQQKAVVTQALFGRGGEKQAEAMQAGRQAIEDYNRKLEEYGVILDHSQLQMAAMAHVAREDFGLAMQGIETQFVAPLQVGFAELDMVLTHVAKDGKSGFQEIGKAIGWVIGEVASFLNGLLDLGLTEKDFAKAADEAAKGTNAQGAGFKAGIPLAKDYQQQITDLRQKTQDQTQALDDEVKALERRKAAMVTAIDDTVRGYQAEQKALDVKLQLLGVQRTLSDDAKKLAKDQRDAVSAAFEGSFDKAAAASFLYIRVLLKQADDTERAQIEADKRVLQGKIDAANEEKRLKVAMFDSQIQQIHDTSTALQRQAQDQEQRLQKLASDSKLPGQAFGDGMDAGLTVGGAALHGFTLKFDTAAQHWGATIRGAFGGDAKSQAALEKLGDEAGQKIGDGLSSGLQKALGKIDWQGVFAQQLFGGSRDQKTGNVDVWKWLVGDGKVQVDKGSPAEAISKALGVPYTYTPGKAGGGAVEAGRAYLVGERGPELLQMGSTAGHVTSHEAFRSAIAHGGAAQPGAVIVNVTFPNYLGDRQELETAMEASATRVYGMLARPL